MGNQNLQAMKTGEVAERARQAGISNVDEKNKAQLIDALEGKGQGGSERFDQRGGGQSQEDPRPEGASPEQFKNVPGNQS